MVTAGRMEVRMGGGTGGTAGFEARGDSKKLKADDGRLLDSDGLSSTSTLIPSISSW